MPPIPADKKQQLKDLIDVMAACGAPRDILTARLRKIIAVLGLPKDAIAEVKKDFSAAGFTVLNVAAGPSAIALLPQHSYINSFETVRDQLHQHMRSDKGKLDPQCAIMQQVQDVFDFLAAYKDNDISAAERYRNSTDYTKLHSEFEMIKNDCGGRTNNYPYRYYLEMAQAAQQLLNSADGSAMKYRRHLQLEGLKKKYPFLTNLKLIPENIKLEPWFAKECLSKLQQCFSEDEAIAFYNFLADLTENPYEKESTVVTVVCPGCNTVHSFPDLKAAQKGKCHCGLPLYRQCPSCDSIWPVVEIYCRECGMNMDAVRNFAAHYQGAESAVRASDPIKARAEYDAARLCNPKETQKLKELNAKIVKLEKAMDEPISNIKALIANKQMNAATQAIAAMGREFPGVDLRAYSDVVDAELKFARQETAKLSSVPKDKIVQFCLAVLQRVADDPSALNELRNHRPNPVQKLIIREYPQDGSCSISWQPDLCDMGVSYTVVRKENFGPPSNVSDGDIVCEDITTHNTRDTGLKPGVSYYYSVFARRGGMESAATSITSPVLLLPDLTQFEASGVDGKCMLSWHRISGSQGVRIRRDNKILVPCVTAGSFVDEDVDDGEDVTYVLQTVWKVGSTTRYSPGISKEVSIEATPDPVEITGNIREGVCRISWQKPGQNRNIILLKLKANQNIPPKTVYSASQLSKMGDLLKNVSSAAGGYTWSVSENVHMRIAAFVQFGDNAVSGNTLSITNVAGCQIDKNRTCIQNKQLMLQMLSVPEKATRIAYSISTERFATYDEAAQLNSVAKNSWKMIKGTSEGQDLYVTVFAVYEDHGGKFYSAPETCLVPAAGKASVKYQITWGGWLRNKRSGATLGVTVENGSSIPAMTLYGSRSGKPIIGNFAKDLVAVCRVPAQSGCQYHVKLDESVLDLFPCKTELKLMLDEDCGNRYNFPEALSGTNIVP